MRNSTKIFTTVIVVFILAVCTSHPAFSRPPVKTWNSYKWRNITRQNYDYSCGAAAYATLLNSYFGLNVNEGTIMTLLARSLSKQELEDRIENGFSMMDIQRIAHIMGFQAKGVELPLNAIFRLKGPVIVILKTKEYEHFVVLKAADDKFAYLADSSRGNIKLPLYDFVDQWDGAALVVGLPGFGLLQFHGLRVSPAERQNNTKDLVRQMSPAFR